MRRTLTLLAAIALLGCTGSPADETNLDAEDECALCGGKADEWGAPEEGSCEAIGTLSVANNASFEELDDDAALNRRAAQNIVDARAVAPFETLTDIDDVRWVGVATLSRLVEYAHLRGDIAECEGAATVELGIISDLDKTVIPPGGDHLELPEAPYPGVTTLYAILERGADGTQQTGDTTYVTARTPDRVVDVPDWLEAHGLPEGPIETGVSGVPWVAQGEKVRDISGVFEAHPEQSFVLFGDTSHRDPEAYKEILALFPDQFRAGLIHMVNMTVSDHRLVGLHLFHDHVEAAAILAGEGVITENDVRTVFDAAVAEGLDIGEPDLESYLDTYVR